MRIAGRIALAAGAAALVFGGVTWWALEGGEVAVLRTRAPDGALHATRVWVADEDGFAWIEAATPEREWYGRILAAPLVALERGGVAEPYVATPLPGDEGHARIRRLLRAKYGLADAWVGLLQDTSRSIAVRLAPVPASPPSATGDPG